MNKIVLDNIVFSLQKAGGVSVVWQAVLNKIMSENSLDYTCLEYQDAISNIFRKEINIPVYNIQQQKGPLSIQRYLSPKISLNQSFIFHSSYYRTIPNSLVKNVTTVHDFTYELFSKGIKQRIHSWQKNSAILKSDKVVCISQNTAKDLMRFCPSVDPKKVGIIYNGVSEDYFPLKDKDENLKDSILFVGSRVGYKNFKFTIDSITDTKYKLAICGAPLNEAEISYLNKTLGVERYRYLGRLDNQELNRVYNSVFCLAYPSSYEGFGIPVLEAQRTKCPVIALNASSIPEVMGNKSILLNNLKANEFHRRLREFENNKVREEIVEEGFLFSQQFSWDKMATEYLNLYEELSVK